MLLRSVILAAFLGAAPAWAQTESGAPATQSNRLIVNIDSPNFRKLVMAVPVLTVGEGADEELKAMAKEGSDELTRLFNFCGLFNVMDQAAYADLAKHIKAGGATGMEGIDLPAWKGLGIESLSVGELTREGKDVTVAMRTADVYQGKLLVGKKYSKVEPKQLKKAMAKYADRVLEAYTGKPGIFSSKLVFVGCKNGPCKTKGSVKNIYVSDFDGSNAKAITNGKTPSLSPQFSKDGRFVTYTSFEDGNPDLYIYELATGKRRKLSGRKGLNSGSNWAPNNKIIAFTGSENGEAEIYTIKPDGTGTKPLIRGDGLDVDPTFSPNGKSIAFVSGRFGNPHLFVAELKWDNDTTVRVLADKRITFAGWYNVEPTWTPESDKIAFAGYDRDTDRWDIFLVNPDGTKLERLTIRTGDNQRPSFAPNGQMIVFHSSRIGDRDAKQAPQLFVMNRDGSAQRPLVTGLAEAQTPQWGPPED